MDFEYVINGYGLELLTVACPEQYHVWLNGEMVGYMRLRHGCFYACAVTASEGTRFSERLYSAHPKGDGCFDDEERLDYLTEAIAAIHDHYNPPSPVVDETEMCMYRWVSDAITPNGQIVAVASTKDEARAIIISKFPQWVREHCAWMVDTPEYDAELTRVCDLFMIDLAAEPEINNAFLFTEKS